MEEKADAEKEYMLCTEEKLELELLIGEPMAGDEMEDICRKVSDFSSGTASDPGLESALGAESLFARGKAKRRKARHEYMAPGRQDYLNGVGWSSRVVTVV